MREFGSIREPLAQPRRAALLERIRTQPGTAFVPLRDAADAANGSATHHLRALEAHGLITSLRLGRYRRYWPVPLGSVAGRRAAALADTQRGRLLKAIEAAPGATQHELAAQTRQTRQAAAYHLQTLQRLQLIRTQRDGWYVRHYAAANGGQPNAPPCAEGNHPFHYPQNPTDARTIAIGEPGPHPFLGQGPNPTKSTPQSGKRITRGA